MTGSEHIVAGRRERRVLARVSRAARRLRSGVVDARQHPLHRRTTSSSTPAGNAATPACPPAPGTPSSGRRGAPPTSRSSPPNASPNRTRTSSLTTALRGRPRRRRPVARTIRALAAAVARPWAHTPGSPSCHQPQGRRRCSCCRPGPVGTRHGTVLTGGPPRCLAGQPEPPY